MKMFRKSHKTLNSMKYFALLLISVLSFQSQGQSPKIPLKNATLNDGISVNDYGQYRGTVNCNVDTVAYVQAKTSNQEAKILYSDNTYSSSAGQMFGASSSSPKTVYGFRWYGYSYDPIGSGSPVLSIDCELYAAGADSLPTGLPLASETISVDVISQARDVVFTTPIVMTSNFIVVVTNSSSTDWLFLASSDEDNNDGAGEGLSCSYYEPAGAWRKNLNLWALGDFDMTFEPFVSYTMDAKFINPGMGCVGIPVDFVNNSTGPMNSKYYNQDKFFGNPLSYFWTYGDGNFSNYLKNGVNTYLAPGTYNVELTDTIFAWTGFCTDNKVASIDIFAIPAAPNSTPPTPVCAYTPANDLTASGSGSNFTWYDDAGLSNSIGSGSPFASGLTQNDTVFVTETVNGCESPGTQVIVDFLPNDIPTFIATPVTGFMVQFTGAPTASSYSWDFGDLSGTSTAPSPSYTFPSAGPFNVCLDVIYSNGCTNQYCETVTFVGVEDGLFSDLNIYPNPSVGLFTIEFNDVLGPLTVEISDLSGRVVYIENMSGTNQLDLSALASGNYLAKIFRGGKYTVSKLIKQ